MIVLKWILAIIICTPLDLLMMSISSELLDRLCDAVENADYSILGRIFIKPIAYILVGFGGPLFMLISVVWIPCLVLGLFGLI